MTSEFPLKKLGLGEKGEQGTQHIAEALKTEVPKIGYLQLHTVLKNQLRGTEKPSESETK